jgi:uncharacterized membrane protein YfcA
MTDIITAFFNFGCIFFLLLNIRALWKAQELKGYSPYAALFFTSWAFWGVYQYWDINFKWSFAAACTNSLAYVVWLGLIAYLKVKGKK